LAAASTEDTKKVALLASHVSELQDSLMEMTKIVEKMSNNQYQDRITVIVLQSKLETKSQKTESAQIYINKCQVTITTIKNMLGTLSIREESNKRFDKIESLLLEQSSHWGKILILTGKKIEQIQEEDKAMVKEEPTMDTDTNTVTSGTVNHDSGTFSKPVKSKTRTQQ
jgi:transcriptional regulator with GAF, ATPase, and Fis domain